MVTKLPEKNDILPEESNKSLNWYQLLGNPTFIALVGANTCNTCVPLSNIFHLGMNSEML